MTPVAERLVAEIDALPIEEREEVIAALLQRAGTDDHDLPAEAGLVAGADALFQDLDKNEQVRPTMSSCGSTRI